MKKNFAGQPAGGGQINILTGRELFTDIQPSTPEGFTRRTLFIDNCKNCDNMESNFLNFNLSPSFQQDVLAAAEKSKTKPEKDGFWSGINFGSVLDTAKTGAQIWSTSQQQKAASDQARLALEIERQRVEQERQRKEGEAAKAEAERAKSGSVASKIRAYSTPILIGGVVIIGGIAAYFYFKRKK
jgi:hypothetical protein